MLTAALVIASLAYSIHETNANASAAYFMTTTRMWELGAGGLLALAPARLTRALARQGWLGWFGLAAVIASAFLLTGSMAFPGALALLPVLGAVALIAGGSAEGRNGPSRLTSARLMVFIGGISYSLYLWHYPLINLYTDWRGRAPGPLSGPVILAVSVLLAWLTKTFVEDKVRLAPFIARHKWRSLAVALVAVVPVALAAVYITAEPGPWNGTLGPNYPGAAALTGVVANVPVAPVLKPPDPISQTLDQTGGCLDDFGASTPKECVFGDTANPVLTVALVGDSAAGEWFDALNAIAVQQALEARDRTALKLSLVVDPAAQLERHRGPHRLPDLGQGRIARPDHDYPAERGDHHRLPELALYTGPPRQRIAGGHGRDRRRDGSVLDAA